MEGGLPLLMISWGPWNLSYQSHRWPYAFPKFKYPIRICYGDDLLQFWSNISSFYLM